MTCSDLLRTQAWLDGELDDRAAAEAERHVAECADCRALSADVADLSDAVRANVSRYRAPAWLHARVIAALDADRARKPERRNFWLGAGSGAGITALAASLAFFSFLPPSAATLAEAVTDAHTSALMRGETIQIVSSNHHTVKPWFAGRVALSPPVADFPQNGFSLAGGRVDEIAGARAAVVVYRHGAHEIDLFVWADKGAELPAPTTRLGYHTVFWKRGDLDFAAVSDTETAELNKFVNLVRGERE